MSERPSWDLPDWARVADPKKRDRSAVAAMTGMTPDEVIDLGDVPSPVVDSFPVTPRATHVVNPDNAEEMADARARAERVIGRDGKTYAKKATPPAVKPQRKPLTTTARDAGWDIRKAADRLTRIQEDDRFSRNKEEVASLLRGHLEYVARVCQDLLSDFDQSRKD